MFLAMNLHYMKNLIAWMKVAEVLGMTVIGQTSGETQLSTEGESQKYW